MKINMVFCDSRGRIYDHPGLLLAGFDGPEPELLGINDVIEVPRGSDIMMLPGRIPVGIDPASGAPVGFNEYDGKKVFAASVFMAPAYTQTFRPAYESVDGAEVLPLYAYSALGFCRGRFYAAGFRVDDDPRQDPWRFDEKAVAREIGKTLKELKGNRLAEQLEKCALEYCCRAAQNFFLGRWEAPLPVSTACNSRCRGCLSLQTDGSFKASHDRLSRPPLPEEVAEVALMHIARVEKGVVSFGQGCEGEPLLQGDLLEKSIRLVRKSTDKGTINLNTNGSLPEVAGKLIDAGLDSIRVSMNSVRKDVYNAYYRPAGYSFEDVVRTINTSKRGEVFVSINLLVFPGITDTSKEIEAFSDVAGENGVDMIQMRNLNIDPEVYLNCLPPGLLHRGMGMKIFKDKLHSKYPNMIFGYFNPSKESFHKLSS